MSSSAPPSPGASGDGSRRESLGRLYDQHGEKLRYLIVGVGNTAISYVLFIISLKTVGVWAATLTGSPAPVLAFIGAKSYLVAQWAAWVLMVPVSTLTMRAFVFRSTGNWMRQVVRGYGVYLPAQAFSSALLWFSVQILRLSPPVGQLVTIVFSTIFSYLGHKYFTFRVPLEVGEVVDEDMLE